MGVCEICGKPARFSSFCADCLERALEIGTGVLRKRKLSEAIE